MDKIINTTKVTENGHLTHYDIEYRADLSNGDTANFTVKVMASDLVDVTDMVELTDKANQQARTLKADLESKTICCEHLADNNGEVNLS